VCSSCACAQLTTLSPAHPPSPPSSPPPPYFPLSLYTHTYLSIYRSISISTYLGHVGLAEGHDGLFGGQGRVELVPAVCRFEVAGAQKDEEDRRVVDRRSKAATGSTQQGVVFYIQMKKITSPNTGARADNTLRVTRPPHRGAC